jgi:molecular chaperone DnaK (HSP70)
MSRPYFNHSIQQLEEEFQKHKANLSIVRQLRTELDHRTKPRALQLREKIDAHLEALAAPSPQGRLATGGSMRFFGIDLGTSKCCVAYAVNSARPNFAPQPTVLNFRRDLLGGKSTIIPSVVTRSRANGPGQSDPLFAFDAEQALEKGHVRGRNCHEVFRSVKSHLGTGRSYVRADPALNTPVKVWASLIRRLCEMTVAEKGAEFDPRLHPTVLTVPASFGKAQRDETIEAARVAGFNVTKHVDLVHLIDEPVAALIDTLNHPDIDLHMNPEDWNTVLVFDLGGGTCDLTLLKFRYDASKPTGIEDRPLAISPYQQLGGDTVDLAIMESVVWPQICQQNGIKREQLTATERQEIEDHVSYTVCRRLKVLVNEDLSRLSDEQLQRQDWSAIKAMLPLHGIPYSNGEELSGDAELRAHDLYKVMLPLLDPDPSSNPLRIGESIACPPFSKLVEITMERAGLTPDKLDLLVLHGGSCLSPLIPWAFERMKEAGVLSRNCKIIRTPDLTASVSCGAALFGCLSKKYGRPYIRPIVPEEMSIQTVGNDFECLVYAGEHLPYKKTFDKFYLSSAGQQEIVVPIYVGYDVARRRLASTLTIPIAQKLPQSHPIDVELEIDIDKDSRWRFRPKGCDWSKAHEVPNVWIGREPTEEINKLLETRKKIRALIDQDGRPPAMMLVEEAIQVARTGFTEEGLALIEDVVADSPSNSLAWNMKGLIHGQRRENQLSLESFEKAFSLEPNDMVYRGNYGSALVCLKCYHAAIPVMREALSKNPSLTYLHSWLAEAFQGLQNTEEMNKELEMWYTHAQREVVRRSEDVSAWEELREVATRLGKYADAEEASEEIRELRRPRNLLAGAKHG